MSGRHVIFIALGVVGAGDVMNDPKVLAECLKGAPVEGRPVVAP